MPGPIYKLQATVSPDHAHPGEQVVFSGELTGEAPGTQGGAVLVSGMAISIGRDVGIPGGPDTWWENVATGQTGDLGESKISCVVPETAVYHIYASRPRDGQILASTQVEVTIE